MPSLRPWARRLVTGLPLVLLAGCGSGSPAPGGAPSPSSTRPPAAVVTSAPAAAPASPGYSKVLVVAEENKTYRQVIGSGDAPYINELAGRYGSAAAMRAGYPSTCPSLAAYVILTSGDPHGICDDADPSAHPLTGDNVFEQVAAGGREWRTYAESMPGDCRPTNSRDGLYLVRHAPAPYYVSERSRCPAWDVPLGTVSAGALHDDLAAGRLPAFSFVTPNACNDMHGAPGCSGNLVRLGDRWLSAWMPQILASPDYRAGRLVVIVTWDEGSTFDNHIPTLVISPTTSHRVARLGYTHCSTLRTVEELLRLPLLGCAARSRSMAAEFGLG